MLKKSTHPLSLCLLSGLLIIATFVGHNEATSYAKTTKSSALKQHAKKLNKRFLSKKLDAKRWKGVLDREKREVFRFRKQIVAALGLKKGQQLADVGAGSGAFIASFVNTVGAKGSVYAVDISPNFIKFLNKRFQAHKNVKVVHSKATSTLLPDNSVDVIFSSDTYHHFSDPKAMLKDFRRILRPGGRLIIVDFKRIPGVSSKWMLNHVRQNQNQVTSQINRNGFVFDKEIKIKGMKQNYIVTFKTTK